MTKIKIRLIIIFLQSINLIFAQSSGSIKEHFDKIYPTSDYSPTVVDYTDCYKVGNGLSWILSSLLRMYEATGDKAYLIKFINHVVQIQNNRRDMINPSDDPVWVRTLDDYCDGTIDNAEPAYFNSLLIYPMAEFVNMIINEPNHSLYNTNIPIQLINNLPNSPTIIGYGDFAIWLGKKVEETIIYMNNNYWDTSFGIKGHYAEDCYNGNDRTCGTAMNWNSPYGCALLYMGLSNTNFGYGNNSATYLYFAQLMASFYKGDMNLDDNCNNNSTVCSNYNYPVLRLRTNGNNSYFWYHAGWGITKDNCALNWLHQPEICKYLEFFEDVSHGAMDLWFVNACYNAQLAPCNTCTPYFTYLEMERFKNTFTQNIYYSDGTGSHFHNTVMATDNFYSENTCFPNCAPDNYLNEVLNWMPVYKFDGSDAPNAYDIILTHTINLISSPTMQYLGGSQSLLGLSEVIKAQWDKECVNLTLYNRHLTYNQDFNVKNKIIISPELNDNFHQTNSNSFAEPTIISNQFIIESGTIVNMAAGESIDMLPGFEAKAGCDFAAKINISACTDGQRLGNPHILLGQEINSLSSSILMDSSAIAFGQELLPQHNWSFNNPEKIINLKIYPNPTDKIINISFSTLENTAISISIKDLFGKTLFNVCQTYLSTNSNYIIPIDISSANPGVYICNINLNGENYKAEKIVFIK